MIRTLICSATVACLLVVSGSGTAQAQDYFVAYPPAAVSTAYYEPVVVARPVYVTPVYYPRVVVRQPAYYYSAPVVVAAPPVTLVRRPVVTKYRYGIFPFRRKVVTVTY
jgi:hypothetical protein